MDLQEYEDIYNFLASVDPNKPRNPKHWPSSIQTLKTKKEKASFKSKLRSKAQNFVIQNGKLFRKCKAKVIEVDQDSDGSYKGEEKWKIVYREVVKSNEKLSILQKYHDDPETGGHRGRNATLAKISKKYWWKGMKKDVTEYVSCCEPCQESKPINEKTPIQSILAEKPLEHIEYDLTKMPKDPSTNSEWILTCIDAFSKYAWCFPLVTKESSKIVACLKLLAQQEGPAVKYHSDNGGEFTSELHDEIIKQLGGRVVHGRPYKPTTQGMIERFNRTIKDIIFRNMKAKNGTSNMWERYLNDAVYAYNTTVHSSTGFTPFHVLRGHPHSSEIVSNANTMEERFQMQAAMTKLIHQKVSENLKKAAARTEKYKNKNAKVREFQIGDKVLVKVPPRLQKSKGLSLYGLHATVEQVEIVGNRKLYRLRWITEGLQNEAPGELSIQLYSARDLKKENKSQNNENVTIPNTQTVQRQSLPESIANDPVVIDEESFLENNTNTASPQSNQKDAENESNGIRSEETETDNENFQLSEGSEKSIRRSESHCWRVIVQQAEQGQPTKKRQPKPNRYYTYN